MWETRDPDGRLVVLTTMGWRHIVARHDELEGERAAILASVSEPVARHPGPETGEEWFYGQGFGPSLFVKVVVHFRGGTLTVKIAGIEFDNNFYDREVDVLYLHVGESSSAVDWDETAEGDGTRYGTDGSLVGITILNARRRLERDGKIVITLPEQRVEATQFDDILAPA